jgi:hypothetical protein
VLSLRYQAHTRDNMDAKPACTIIADSIAPSGIRLTTALLTYATIVHQDFLTHRTVYKYNTSKGVEWAELDSNKSTNSNRAKPTKQVLQEVLHTPFVPTRFPIRAATMHSSRGYLTGWKHLVARHVWLKGRYVALSLALLLMWVGCHKQLANRILMPWTMTTLVMTAVDTWWEHFISLRDHYMAQDEVQEAAALFTTLYVMSEPDVLAEGDWHLPFVTEAERYTTPHHVQIMLSVARCARTSYASDHATMLLAATTRPLQEDIDLCKRLLPQLPEHAGPKEHQASAHSDPNHRSGTLHGWDQLRHSPTATTLLGYAASL